MMRALLIFVSILSLFSCSNSTDKNNTKTLNYPTHSIPSSDQVLTKIAFGSCNKHDKPQPMWATISQHQPDLWIWLGDIIYGDTPDTSLLREKYLAQKTKPEYAAFIQNTPTIGIWDDHDYGKNDGGKEWKIKKQSKQILLDFLDVSPKAEVRKREGAYQSFTFGKPNQKVKIILLDSRYFRDPVSKGNKGTLPNQTGDILGEAQWIWLENELHDTTIQLFLVGNGIQFLSDEHPYEKWANFPKSRERFISLLGKQKKSRIILLSGDRHHGEIAKLKINDSILVHEITSSGLTHSYEGLTNEKNNYRIGDFVNKVHFGMIEIDWQSHTTSLTLRGTENQLYEELKITF